MNIINSPIIIGIDHGYGNIKTANCCFKTGVASFDKEPTFKSNLLVYEGRCYLIGEEHKEFTAGKMAGSDYYVIMDRIIQSFKPGEISPEEANRIGYELAMKFTKGQHQFVVSTHVDKAHIHTHIMAFSDAQLSLTYSDEMRSAYSVLSDRHLGEVLLEKWGLCNTANPSPPLFILISASISFC